MTRSDEEVQDGLLGEVVDEGAPEGLLQEKMENENYLRRQETQDEGNVNDQPGFDDGRLGGRDYEDREGEPNSLGGSDLGGDESGGTGTERSGGIDGGPARKTPLPGDRK